MAKHVAESTQYTLDREEMERRLEERDDEYRWDLQFDEEF